MLGEKAVKGLRPFAPQPFGRYTLLAPLASGGMGEVFLARLEGAEGFEKRVVIKKILPALAHDQDFIDRFVTEAKVLVKLHHGSVAQVLDMGQQDGDYFIALEFVDGKDLRKVAARCKERGHTVPLGLTLFVAMRVLDALAYAHRKKGEDEADLNLVHRDVSPQNVLISYEGEVKVIDFGLAKSSLSLGRTSPNVVLGKFFYMSPEQAKHAKVDRRSDLYATGICLYELIAGKNPFEGVPQGELMARVADPHLEPLGMAMPGVPPAVEQLVMRALAPDPKDRFATAEEMRGRMMAAMLELDPGAGPESLAHFMRAVFANEYAHERKVFASLREAVSASAHSDARTGLMPVLRLAGDDEQAIHAGPGGVTQVAPGAAPTPATAETHVGPVRPVPVAAELPKARESQRTELAEPAASDDAGPTLIPLDGPPIPGRRTTDPAQAPLHEPEALFGEASRLGPPPGTPAGLHAAPGEDPQEFQLPRPTQPELEVPVVVPAVAGDLVPGPVEPSLPILQASLVEPDPEPELPALETEPRPVPAKPAASSPRVSASAVRAAPRLDPGLPKVVVSDDLHQDGVPPGQRIETVSTRPLISSAPRDPRPRGPSGERERPVTGTTRRPAAPGAVRANEPSGPRAPAASEPGPKASSVDASTKRSLVLGLGIGAGLVVLAVAGLVLWSVLH